MDRASWSSERRAIAVRVAGEERFAAAEDAPATATRSARRCPLGLPAAFTEPVERAARASSSPATPAPTARSSPPHPRRRLGVPVPAGRSAALRHARGRRPRRAGRVPARRRGAGVVRRRRAAPAAAALARRAAPEVEPVEPEALARFLPAWQGVAAGARRGVDGLVEALGCCRAPVLGVDRSTPTCCRRGCAATAGRPRRALHRGRPGVGRRGRDRRGGRSGPPVLPRPGALLLPAARRRRPAGGQRARRAPRAPRAAGRLLLGRAAGRGRRGHRRRAARRAVGPGVGGRGHQRLAGARAGAARRREPRGAPVAGGRPRPRPGRLARLGPPAGAGRWSLVRRCSSPDGDPRRSSRTPRPCSCSSATACSPARRCWPRASRAASPASTACSRCWRSAARCGAATSWPVSARPSSPCPARSIGCGRHREAEAEDAADRAGRHRSGPALRRRAGLAGVGGPAGSGRRGAGRARSAASASPGSTGAGTPGHVPGRRRGRSLGRRARRPGEGRAGALARGPRIDGEPAAASPVAPMLRAAGFVDGYRGLVLRE